MAEHVPPMEIAVVRGEVPDGVLDYAEKKVRGLFRLAPAPVLFARIHLAHEQAPGLERPAVAKATLDVNGRLVRAHVAASAPHEAVDLLEDKLRQGLETYAEKRQARRHEPAEVPEGTWRHGALPTARPEYFPRPVEERELVRRKSYLYHRQTAGEAAEDLALLDHEWGLFTESTTGSDALLEVTDAGYRLTLLDDRRPEYLDLDGQVEVHLGAPRMDLATAVRLLDEINDNVVFFRDTDTDRGRVVYRRYDGHYGTISAEPEPATPTDVPAPVRSST